MRKLLRIQYQNDSSLPGYQGREEEKMNSSLNRSILSNSISPVHNLPTRLREHSLWSMSYVRVNRSGFDRGGKRENPFDYIKLYRLPISGPV